MSWKDRLWNVVEEAVQAGIGPRVFLAEVRECWEQALRDRLRDEPKEFDRDNR